MASTESVDKPVIHLRHFKDGYPMCWSYDQDGPFEGSYKDAEVTCPECIEIINEWDE